MHTSIHTYAHLSRHISIISLCLHFHLLAIVQAVKLFDERSQFSTKFVSSDYYVYGRLILELYPNKSHAEDLPSLWNRWRSQKEKHTSMKTFIYLAYLVLKMMFLNLGKTFTDEKWQTPLGTKVGQPSSTLGQMWKQYFWWKHINDIFFFWKIFFFLYWWSQ